MRIVYIIDGLGIGGAERTTVQLAVGMQNRAHTVHVIAVPRISFLDSTDKALRATYDELVLKNISVSVIPKKKRFSFRFLRTLTQCIREIQPDIVHTQLYTADTFGVLAARWAHVQCVVSTEQNVNLDEGAIKTALKSYIHRFHRDVACISKAVRAYVQSTAPSTRSYRLPIIHNSVDIDRFASLPERGTHKVPVMTIVGRLVPQKGHVRFLRSIAQVSAPYRLRIVGSGVCEQEIRNAIAELDLEEKVSLEPARTDVERVFAESDIVVVPSLWEGLGIVALEAQASAKPVIASRVDGLSEVVQDRVTGRCVDMHNEKEVVAVCTELLTSPELCLRYGQAGRVYAQEHFSSEHMCNQYEQWYQSL